MSLLLCPFYKAASYRTVIRYLEENGYEIKSVSGCSMGALIGGFYAAGKLEIYTDWLTKLDTFDMVKLLDFKGSGGLVSGETLMSEMKKLIGNKKIVLVNNKSDLFTKVYEGINISALSGEGIEELKDHLISLFADDWESYIPVDQ